MNVVLFNQIQGVADNARERPGRGNSLTGGSVAPSVLLVVVCSI